MHHHPFSSAARAALVAAFVSGSACAVVDADSGPSPCDGKCDDPTSAAPLVSCWIEPGQGTEVFFITDTLVCSRGVDPVYDLVVVNAVSASRGGGGEQLEAGADGPTTIMRLARQDGYPVRLEVELLAGNLGANNILPTRLVSEISLSGPDAATAAQPRTWRVPFQVGTVVLDSHLDQGELSVAYPLDLAPFVDAAGATSVTIRKGAQLIAGRQIRLDLPSRGGPLAATVGDRATPLPGFGHFALTSDGVTPVAEPTGPLVVSCAADTAGEPDAARPVRCTLAAPAELTLDAASAVVAGAAGAVTTPLAADVAVEVGALAPGAGPLTVTMRATLRPSGATRLDPGLAGRTIELTVAVPADGSAASGRLGLELWSTTITCQEELCMIDRPAFLLPLPTPSYWATRVEAGMVVELDRGAQATFVFASPAGQRAFAGNAGLLVGSDFVDKAVDVGPGTFVLDQRGLTPGS